MKSQLPKVLDFLSKLLVNSVLKENTVLRKVNTVLTKESTVLTKVNTLLMKENIVLTKENTVLQEDLTPKVLPLFSQCTEFPPHWVFKLVSS